MTQKPYRLLQFLGGFIFALSMIATSPAWAADEQMTFEDLFLRWNNTLYSNETTLSQPGIGNLEMRPLVENVKVIKESALKVRASAKKELIKQQNLLNVLGAAPAVDAPPEAAEITENRTVLTEQVTYYDSQVKRCNLVLTRANALLEQIADVEYEQVTTALYQRRPLPLAPRSVAAALVQLPKQLVELRDAGSNWLIQKNLNQPGKFGFTTLLAILLGFIALGLWVSRWLHQRYSWGAQVEQPTSNQKITAALIAGLIRVVLPVLLIAIFVWITISGFGADGNMRLILSTLVFTLIEVVVINGLAKVTLAPNHPQFRISKFTDQAAIRLSRAIFLFTITALALDVILVLLITRTAPSLEIPRITTGGATAELVSLMAIISVVVVASFLLNVLRSANWRFVNLDTDPISERAPHQIFRILINIARTALVAGIILGLAGFLNFGLFVVIRTFWVLGLIGMARLLHGFFATVLIEVTSPENRLGVWVRKHLGLGDSSSARTTFWITLFFDIALFALVILGTLLMLGVPWEDIRPVLTGLVDGTQIGDHSFSLINVANALGVFVVLLIAVRLFQRFLSTRILVQTSLDIGVRDALSSGIGYVGIVIVVLLTLSALGLKMSELAIIFGALSVGIGFGLQHVVNNFISGLVLLIQRPIKAGDWVVVGDQEGYVKQVNVVTTEIQTFDNAALIVPNSDLVSSQVINWMHKSKLGRVKILVGVAYSSDPEQVSEILMKCATQNPDALKRPEPNVIFRDFGESALIFELRYFIRDMDYYWRSSSAVRFAIMNAFRESGIEIPFPQRDLHIRDPKRMEAEDVLGVGPE